MQYLTDDLETVSYIKDGRGVLEAGVRVEYDVEKFNMKETAETRTMIEQLWAERTRSNARLVLCSAPSVPQPVVQSRRRPLLGPSPG